MALAFSTGTINQPDAGSVGLAMIEKLRDDIVAHAAWDLVEEFTAASGTVRWYVFKNLSTESGLPADWYVVIGRTLGNGELRAAICEGYNSATHTMSFYCVYQTAFSTAFDSLGRQTTGTYVLGTVPFPNSGPSPHYHFWVPSGTSTKYWIIVDNDGFSVAFSGVPSASGFFHFSAFIPLASILIPMPVCSVSNDGGSSDSLLALLRNPAAVGVSSPTNIALFGVTWPNSQGLGFRHRLDMNDKLQNNERPVGELGILMYNGTSDPTKYGYCMGKHKRIRYGTSPPSGMSFGDAYVMQGRLWVPFLVTDGRMWDTGVSV